MEYDDVEKMRRKLEELNPSGRFEAYDNTIYLVPIIAGNVSKEKLILPDGFYCDEDSYITNEDSVKSGIYELFLYEYVPHFFEKRRNLKMKRRKWFSHILC